jgi:hypothetical protein
MKMGVLNESEVVLIFKVDMLDCVKWISDWSEL